MARLSRDRMEKDPISASTKVPGFMKPSEVLLDPLAACEQMKTIAMGVRPGETSRRATEGKI